MEKKLVEPRALAAAELLLDGAELAIVLKRSPVTIRNQLYRSPEKLPPFVAGSAPRVWYLPAVEAWLLNRSSAPSATPAVEQLHTSKRGRGRPRHSNSGGAK